MLDTTPVHMVIIAYNIQPVKLKTCAFHLSSV